MRVLISLALLAAISNPALASTLSRQYLVRVPGGNFSCDQAAQNLAVAFARALPTATNIVGKCASDSTFSEAGKSYHTYTLTVDYSATTLVPFYQAALTRNSMWDITPVYTNYADCLADIAPQSDLFQRATGLPVLAASCALTQTRDMGYSLTLDAIGTPVRYLQQMEDHVAAVGESTEQDPVWKKAIIEDLIADGAMIAKNFGSTTYYYARQAINYSSDVLVSFSQLNLCTSQLDEAKKIIAATGAKNGTIDCNRQGVSVFMRVRGNFSSQSLGNDYGSRSPLFHDLAECLQNRDQVVSENQAVAGLCVDTPSDEHFYQVYSFRP